MPQYALWWRLWGYRCPSPVLKLFSKILFVLISCLLSFNTNAIIRSTSIEGLPHPQAIGHYWNGRLVGAKELSSEGEGYKLIRLERHHNYGHASLIEFVQNLSKHAQKNRLGKIWVGDLSARQGGRLEKNHRSHQNGLDVDLFFYGEPTLASASVVGRSGLNALWKPAHGELIRLTAAYEEVERIFVHQAIKQHLCHVYRGAAWLRKVQVAKGHDDHIHVRLSCPKNNPLCVSQPAPAAKNC